MIEAAPIAAPDLILNDGGIVPSPVFSRTTCGSSHTLLRNVSIST